MLSPKYEHQREKNCTPTCSLSCCLFPTERDSCSADTWITWFVHKGETATTATRAGTGKLYKTTDLNSLWKEWDFELNRVKPTKHFTYHESGENKFNYSQCKVFRDAVIQMIAKGFTSDTAMDWIYLMYGECRLIIRFLR